ncbi:hypothetical protein ACTP13_10435 [Paenibacillus peoriae]|uniref:hypothetical protein n=1 Tax=Paenibacillus peoriae TaxID=59893 RepID=UPI003F9CF8B6
MRLSESYNDSWFEGEGKKCCFVCGKVADHGGLWYGHASNPDDQDPKNRSTVVCGNYCLEKVLQLVMDALIDSRSTYLALEENEKEFFGLLRNDMQGLLDHALTKKLANIRLRKTVKLIDQKFEEY